MYSIWGNFSPMHEYNRKVNTIDLLYYRKILFHAIVGSDKQCEDYVESNSHELSIRSNCAAHNLGPIFEIEGSDLKGDLRSGRSALLVSQN